MDVCLCLCCGGMGGVGGEWVWLGAGSVRVGCYVCVNCESGLFV